MQNSSWNPNSVTINQKNIASMCCNATSTAIGCLQNQCIPESTNQMKNGQFFITYHNFYDEIQIKNSKKDVCFSNSAIFPAQKAERFLHLEGKLHFCDDAGRENAINAVNGIFPVKSSQNICEPNELRIEWKNFNQSKTFFTYAELFERKPQIKKTNNKNSGKKNECIPFSLDFYVTLRLFSTEIYQNEPFCVQNLQQGWIGGFCFSEKDTNQTKNTENTQEDCANYVQNLLKAEEKQILCAFENENHIEVPTCNQDQLLSACFYIKWTGNEPKNKGNVIGQNIKVYNATTKQMWAMKPNLKMYKNDVLVLNGLTNQILLNGVTIEAAHTSFANIPQLKNGKNSIILASNSHPATQNATLEMEISTFLPI